MQYQDFVAQVRKRAKMDTQDEAVRAIKATFETLAERLFGNEAEHIASQLPQELGDILRQVHKEEKFSVDEFYDRITEREGVKKPDSVYHTRVVIEVLKEAISPGEYKHILDQLPEEFEPVFESGSSGRMHKK